MLLIRNLKWVLRVSNSLRYSQSPWKHGIETGVSATHLDWTMVPYVRKSFYKHFKDGMKYIEGFEPVNEPHKPIEKVSIESPWYAKELYPKAYQYALDMTEKETRQAVEGMYHNLKY